MHIVIFLALVGVVVGGLSLIIVSFALSISTVMGSALCFMIGVFMIAGAKTAADHLGWMP